MEKIEPELPKELELPKEPEILSAQPVPAADAETDHEKDEPSLSIEELERELFGETEGLE